MDISKAITFVNEQIQFHERMLEKHQGNERRSLKHRETAASFKELAEFIQRISEGKENAPLAIGGKPIQLALSFDEIDGLPQELIQELSVSEGDRTDFTILKVIESVGGIASLDRILVGIYRQTGEIMKRATLTSRVYRMAQKGLVFSIANRKGVYSLRELSEADAERLLGAN